MLHQNELQGNTSATRQGQSPADIGRGNRASEANERESADFYNEWDGGGAGGAHTRHSVETGGRGGLHTGRGPKGYQRSDERIREDVYRALTDDDLLDASEIEVSVSNREVTLSGTVQTREDKRRAEILLDDIAGVTDVHNRIRVASAAGRN